jgi:hypothetical protein
MVIKERHFGRPHSRRNGVPRCVPTWAAGTRKRSSHTHRPRARVRARRLPEPPAESPPRPILAAPDREACGQFPVPHGRRAAPCSKRCRLGLKAPAVRLSTPNMAYSQRLGGKWVSPSRTPIGGGRKSLGQNSEAPLFQRVRKPVVGLFRAKDAAAETLSKWLGKLGENGRSLCSL